MYYLQILQLALRLLALLLLCCTWRVIYLRLDADKYKRHATWPLYQIKKRKKYITACVVIVAIIVAIVEGIIAPRIGRHYFPLLDVHLFLCAIMVASGCLAVLFSAKHPLFGRLTEISTVLVSLTGFALTYYLH